MLLFHEISLEFNEEKSPLNEMNTLILETKKEKKEKDFYFQKDKDLYTNVGSRAIQNHKLLLEKIDLIANEVSFSKRYFSHGSEIGIITRGLTFSIVHEAINNLALNNTVELLNLNLVFPTENKIITEFIIGENGIKLSGGQKQRLSIARAILKDSSIILLDEATSSLDSESESIIQNAIENLTKNKTTIIIAHRLSTIMNCDKILVFDNGQIVDEGSHEFLVKNSSIYKSLYEKQIINAISVFVQLKFTL